MSATHLKFTVLMTFQSILAFSNNINFSYFYSIQSTYTQKLSIFLLAYVLCYNDLHMVVLSRLRREGAMLLFVGEMGVHLFPSKLLSSYCHFIFHFFLLLQWLLEVFCLLIVNLRGISFIIVMITFYFYILMSGSYWI